jgi:hypothetical protein
MTPERLAAMELAANEASGGGSASLSKLDESVSPVTGRRFTRA